METRDITCIYCGAQILAEVPDAYDGDPADYLPDVPHAWDDQAWEDLAQQHAPDCDWVTTRAHRLPR